MDPQATQQVSIIAALQHGGFATLLIAITLAFAVAFIVERFIRIYLQLNINGDAFMFEVQKYVMANDLDGALRVCNGAKNAALPRVIKAGLMRASRSEEQIQN
jgi:biopolymer transport protein ExbB